MTYDENRISDQIDGGLKSKEEMDMYKQSKAEEYAKKAWGVYFDDIHPDSAITESMGELTIKDYLVGYNQAIEDLQSDQSFLDECAMRAMQVALGEYNLANGISDDDLVILSKSSYHVAEIMLKARKEALK